MVIMSLWADGNFQAWKRKKLEASRTKTNYQNRFVIPAKTIENEFSQCGLKINHYFDFIR